MPFEPPLFDTHYRPPRTMAVYSRGVAKGARGHELLSQLLLLSSLPPDVRNVALDLDHLWQALTAWRNRSICAPGYLRPAMEDRPHSTRNACAGWVSAPG